MIRRLITLAWVAAMVVTVASAMMLVVTGCSRNSQEVSKATATATEQAAPSVDTKPDQKLKAIASGSNELPAMVEMGADWCPPCRRMKPIVESLKEEYDGKVDIVYIDVDRYKDIAREYQVQSIPVQLFFDENGKQVFRHVGFFSEKQIKSQFSDMGVE